MNQVMKPSISIKLWSINRWLRYTGIRLFIVARDDDTTYSRIGLMWWGWKNF